VKIAEADSQRSQIGNRQSAIPASWQGKILVPFPIEAPLSGVGKMVNLFPGRTYLNSRLWYRRPFEVPAQWKGRRTLLHFGAVDWEATVYLNGSEDPKQVAAANAR
jgi:beta-galactosidase/beta-glucuronidase